MTRAFESNGPDVKVRGTAAHIAEKYLVLARDALSSGDNVAAENYFQHAEHYNRIIAAAQAQTQQAQPEFRRDGGDDDSYDGERSMNGQSMDFGRDESGYRHESDSDGDDDTDEAPPPQQQASQQQPSEPERPRRRRRARSDDQAEAPAPRSRGGEKKAAAVPNGAADGDEDTTHDGQAALAAFPD